MTALNVRPGSGPPQTLVEELAEGDLAHLDTRSSPGCCTWPLTQTMRVPVLFGVPSLA
jgi:hypothetical protein